MNESVCARSRTSPSPNLATRAALQPSRLRSVGGRKSNRQQQSREVFLPFPVRSQPEISLVGSNAAPARATSTQLAALVVSAVEAEALASVPSIESLHTTLRAARILSTQYPFAVVTAGGDGVAFVASAGEEGAILAVKVNLVSTHGAGDEFIGVLSAQIAAGEGIETARTKANAAAAVLVSTPHNWSTVRLRFCAT